MLLWILITTAVLLIIGLVAAVLLYKGKAQQRGPDYYALFLMGVIWLPIGIVGMIRDGSSIFFILGLVFIAVGLANKKDWKKNHVPFSKLSERGKKVSILVTAILTFLVLAIMVILLLNRI